MKYDVDIIEKTIYNFEIEAENEEEAKEKAYKLYESKDKRLYVSDCDIDFEIGEY